MDFCAVDANATIGNTDFTWAQALAKTADSFPYVSYIRPSSGGALLPWIYTVVVIIVHVPTVIIRVVRWELVQSWCLIFTFFTVVVYIQAYVSTQFDPAKILVWTPVILIIDAGSMLQVFFLVIEAKMIRVGSRNIVMDLPDNGGNSDSKIPFRLESSVTHEAEARPSSYLLTRLCTWLHHNGETRFESEKHHSYQSPESDKLRQKDNNISIAQPKSNAQQFHYCCLRDQRVWVALLAAILFAIVLLLQIFGLVKAIQAVRASSDSLVVNWCSTLFQPFGVAAVDGDCNVYEVTETDVKGIGCIPIQGAWQQSWLKGTVAALAIEILAEMGDFTILYLVNNISRWRGVKMRRPWISIFSGMIVLLATLVCSVFYATNLPPKITGRMMVLMDSPSKASYMVDFTSAGLRGDINSWNDGLFESWKGIYFGN